MRCTNMVPQCYSRIMGWQCSCPKPPPPPERIEKLEDQVKELERRLALIENG